MAWQHFAGAAILSYMTTVSVAAAMTLIFCTTTVFVGQRKRFALTDESEKLPNCFFFLWLWLRKMRQIRVPSHLSTTRLCRTDSPQTKSFNGFAPLLWQQIDGLLLTLQTCDNKNFPIWYLTEVGNQRRNLSETVLHPCFFASR